MMYRIAFIIGHLFSSLVERGMKGLQIAIDRYMRMYALTPRREELSEVEMALAASIVLAMKKPLKMTYDVTLLMAREDTKGFCDGAILGQQMGLWEASKEGVRLTRIYRGMVRKYVNIYLHRYFEQAEQSKSFVKILKHVYHITGCNPATTVLFSLPSWSYIAKLRKNDLPLPVRGCAKKSNGFVARRLESNWMTLKASDLSVKDLGKHYVISAPSKIQP